MTALRHEFYETDERLTLSIFDKGADPEQVKINIEPRRVGLYRHLLREACEADRPMSS